MTTDEAARPHEYSDVEYVFEPHASRMPDLRQYVEAMWERRRFMAELARSDLRSARSSTALGSVWSVLDPLFQAAIYFFLYTVLRRGATGQSKFLPVLLAGMFLFQLSMNALGEGGASIKRSKGLVLNSTFPRAILPITNLYKNLREFVPCALVLVVIFPLVGGTIGAGIFVLPLLFAIQMVMNVGIVLLVSTFVTLVADGRNVMTYVSRVLFFATPVVYPVSLLPASAKLLIGWQPLFPLFSAYQAVFSGGVPNPVLVLESAAWAFALLVIGGQWFLRREREFPMHL